MIRNLDDIVDLPQPARLFTAHERELMTLVHGDERGMPVATVGLLSWAVIRPAPWRLTVQLNRGRRFDYAFPDDPVILLADAYDLDFADIELPPVELKAGRISRDIQICMVVWMMVAGYCAGSDDNVLLDTTQAAVKSYDAHWAERLLLSLLDQMEENRRG